jgi:hypothetical protein
LTVFLLEQNYNQYNRKDNNRADTERSSIDTIEDKIERKFFRKMALSIRRLTFLVTLVTFALARQPGTSGRRRTIVRGASTRSQHFSRNLGIGHGDENVSGKGGKQHKGSKTSGKSPKPDGNAMHEGDDDDDDEEEEVEEPTSAPKELPTADDSSSDENDHKSPKGDGPAAKEGKGSSKKKGHDKVDEKDKGKGKGSEHFQHGEYEQ